MIIHGQTASIHYNVAQSVAESRRAHELEPFSLTIYAKLVRHLYYARHYDEAIAECRKLIEMEPRFAALVQSLKPG